MSDENRGLYNKYRVERIDDPQEKHSRCTFFVLDLRHDKFSRPALRAYAKACEKEFPELAKDIRWLLKFPMKDSLVTSDGAMRMKLERNRSLTAAPESVSGGKP